MTTKDTGGPAFPAQHFDLAEGEHGLTIRDYFAAKAMPAVLALCQNDGRDPGTSYIDHCAAMSYKVADAMLKARQA